MRSLLFCLPQAVVYCSNNPLTHSSKIFSAHIPWGHWLANAHFNESPKALRVLPYIPYRQSVVSFPFAMRYWLSSKPRLTTAIVGIINNAISNFIKRRAKDAGYSDVQSGFVTFLQRFGGFLNLNIHAHILVTDGFYHQPDKDGPVKFVSLPPPDDAQVQALCEGIAKRIIRCLQRKGLLPKNADLTEVEKPTPDNLHELYPPMAESIKAICVALLMS